VGKNERRGGTRDAADVLNCQVLRKRSNAKWKIDRCRIASIQVETVRSRRTATCLSATANQAMEQAKTMARNIGEQARSAARIPAPPRKIWRGSPGC
jgi:hypothetical protein